MQRIIRLVALAAAIALVPLLTVGEASAGPFMWEGLTWSPFNGSAVEETDGSATFTRTAAGDAWLQNDLPTAINGNGTPWVQFTYVDDGTSQQGIDLFVNPDSSGARLSGGSLFNCDGLAWERFGVPAQEQVALALGPNCGTANPDRTPGTHTIYVGQRLDGTIDYQFDGIWYSGRFLRSNLQTPFTFDEVLLRWRAQEPTGSVTFVDFQFGADHATPPDQPNAAIRKLGDDGFVGFDVINDTAEGQMKSANGRKKSSKLFQVEVANTTGSELTFTGTDGNRKFKPKYYDELGDKITDDVLGSGFNFGPQPGEQVSFLLEVKFKKKAKPGKTRDFQMTVANSTGDAVDVVQATVNST